jgi:uncharacterized membrane protein YhhN
MRGLGYLISIISVVLIGLVAWPRPEEPSWKVLTLLAGMALSILGMGLRWMASSKQEAEMSNVENHIGLARPAE